MNEQLMKQVAPNKGESPEQYLERLSKIEKGMPTTPQSTTPENFNQLEADFHELETRLREANEKLEVCNAKELCRLCNRHWSPSLIESSVCIFCINNSLKADCADYREALETVESVCRSVRNGSDAVKAVEFAMGEITEALSLTSGKELLAANTKLVEECENALKVVTDETDNSDILCKDGFTMSFHKNSEVHRQLLDALTAISNYRKETK